MDSKGRSAIPHLPVISVVLFASLAGLPRHAIPQDQPTTQGSTSQSPCKCWIDVKTGKRVGSVPIVPTGGKGSTVAELSADGKTAFNTTTKQNFALEPCPQTGRTQPPTTPSGTTGTIDRCLVGTWRSESYVGASFVRYRGGSGILLSVKADGQTTIDYSGMQPVEQIHPVTQATISKEWRSGEATGHITTNNGLVTVSSVEKSQLTGKETNQYGTKSLSASGLGTVFLGGGKAPSPYNLNYACSETALAIKQVVGSQALRTFNFKREKKEP